ncbi:VOC family protein [Amycolatopsis sp. cmx-11-51]|uniref:VOC family protein n=1 Tax=unclassified Amycolatopsis TaxID=2618356 RepID=UPI0039E62E1D
MNIDRIQFLTVPVSDQAKARDFYVGKLGFDLLIEVSGPFVLADRPVGDLDHDACVHLQPTTTDVDVEEIPWGRVTSPKDPDGNGIGLLEASSYRNRPR